MPIDLVELYKQAEDESKKRATPGGNGQKAEQIRQMVRQLAKALNTKELLHAAAYQAVKRALAEKGIEVQRSYFTQVVSKSFKTFKKDDGRVYIKVD